MRKIKFRGFNAKNNKWLYGSHILNRGKHFVAPDEFANGKTWEDYEVEGTGQFTGLTDKNGKEIYEGDIIRINLTDGSTNKSSVFWNNRRGYWGCDIDIINHGVELGLIDKVRIEVIGNIHDNPELINKRTND